jgi:hypothetical protein
VKALEDLIKECDSALTLQMQKFGEMRKSVQFYDEELISPSIFQREAPAKQWSEH